jgi:uncharacterized heparinase superfamily protein
MGSIMGFLKQLLLYWNTVKYLRLSQVFYRLKVAVHRSKSLKFQDTQIRKPGGEWVRFKNFKHSELTNKNSINLLGVEGEVDDWNSESKSLLWTYHVNYFDYASDLLSEDESNYVNSLIKKWVDSNTRTYEPSWDPYPISLRLVNWIKFSLNGNHLSKTTTDNIYSQAVHLYRNIEYHLYGNHLFKNAKALCFAGLFLQNKEAEQWLKKGVKILRKEIKEQILNDGGNFELSPMYHSNMIEDILDLINLHKTFPDSELVKITDSLNKAVPKSMNWLYKMSHPDGQISFFNDSALKIALSPDLLESYSSLLDIQPSKEKETGTTHLKESGYGIILSKNFKLICDIGPVGPDYIPGHGHADTLSFELSVLNQRVFVNSGISLYEESEKRSYQRKTRAHNTVEINKLDSSETWKSFRIARRAYPEEVKVGIDSIEASHNGYARIKSNIRHKRKWKAHEKQIIIEDNVSGSFKSACAFFHLHPEIRVTEETGGSLLLKHKDFTIVRFLTPNHKIIVEDSLWYPQFGTEIPNKTLKIEFKGNELRSLIELT